MPSNVVVRVKANSPALQQGLQAIEAELELPGAFPLEVTQAATAALSDVVLPELDRTDIEFITIDPEGSMDLDQAMQLERSEHGFVVHYAIADVAAFVEPGGPIDLEAHRRGETLYGAGSRIPLHPPELSEGAASLLPDQVCPALLWTLDLDAEGNLTRTHVERAKVRSRQRWSYRQAQAAIDDGQAPEVLALLKEVGQLRQQQERDRGGISLPLPEQEIDETDAGFELTFREQLPAEEWNAQISLLTGIGAASLMVKAKVGLLRTLPPADPRDVKRLRRVAHGLKVEWPRDMDYPDFIRSLDPTQSQHQAMVVSCTRLLRGSGYAAFDGDLPEQRMHSAIAAEYAHATAPLRRLCDRYVGEVCVALCAGDPVPDWVRSALPDLPKTMQTSGQRAGAYERAVLGLLEALVLAHGGNNIGREYDGVIIDVRDGEDYRGEVILADIGVEAPITSDGALPLGEEVTATLASVDVAARKVAFTLA
ncbi:MAG: RNB domain-containing ribonuclease [Nocardioidaceae bacterium]|nr:RNB domain-containing ribonuclease [Nocardioidaceae bacterium]